MLARHRAARLPSDIERAELTRCTRRTDLTTHCISPCSCRVETMAFTSTSPVDDATLQLPEAAVTRVVAAVVGRRRKRTTTVKVMEEMARRCDDRGTTTDRCISARQYYAYRLQVRRREDHGQMMDNSLSRYGRLFQEYC
eukprot:866191-Pyramimonas_sp.AAC.1